VAITTPDRQLLDYGIDLRSFVFRKRHERESDALLDHAKTNEGVFDGHGISVD
jgi:hypothetical protein